MIHRAPLGSIERFVGLLIEHYEGNFPTWLTPIQVKVLPISKRHQKYGEEIEEKLKKEGIRTEIDIRNATLPAKIRDAQIEKVSYMLIVGDREEKNKTVRERSRSGQDFGEIKLEAFIKKIKKEIESKSLA